MSAADQFSAFVRAHASKAGYDLSGPRSGGRKQLANDTGMSHASVCRMLNGQVIPSAEFFESLAHQLNVHVGYLFELAGIVSPGVLTSSSPTGPQPLTVREYAARIGIRNPTRVALLEAITATLLAEQEAQS
jgi:hypothetical protein